MPKAPAPALEPALEPALATATELAAPARYEDALAELERLVTAMEEGRMPLDSLLDSYRRGAELLEFCRDKLRAVEAQVKVLEQGQLKEWTGE